MRKYKFLCRVGARWLGSVVPVVKTKEFPLKNEPILSYKKGSKERAELEKALDKMSNECEDIPLVIGDKEIRTENCVHQVMVRIIFCYSIFFI